MRERAPSLLVITDRCATRGRPLIEVVREAIAGGARWFQLREKDLDGGPLLELARALAGEIQAAGGRLLVNDRIDVALAAGADGVVLPAASFPTAVARTLLGRDRILARSTHAAAEVEQAAADGCDFALFGPVFDTPAKRPYGEPQGLAQLRDVTSLGIPVLAVGGITFENAAAVRAAGARGIAVIREVMAVDSPRAATSRLLPAHGSFTSQR